jgi:hypothetical protein
MLTEPREALLRRSTFEYVAGTPGRIDLATIYEDDARPALFTKAVYAIEADVLTYCVAPPGRERPRELATRPGDDFTLVVLKRVPDRPRRPDTVPWLSVLPAFPGPVAHARIVGPALGGNAWTALAAVWHFHEVKTLSDALLASP